MKRFCLICLIILCLQLSVLLAATMTATFPNQGRHLVRQPNTSILHRVYEENAKNSWEAYVVYQKSTDWGTNWSAPCTLDIGDNPCISLGTLTNAPWVLYYQYESGITYWKCAVKKTDGNWKIWVVHKCEPEEFPQRGVCAPSMVHAMNFENEPGPGDLAYAVFSNGFQYIFFVAFDSIRTYCVQDLDFTIYVYTPSISITPGDWLHVAWSRQTETEYRIYYKTIEEAITPDAIRNGNLPRWSDLVPISTQYPLTEPAENPSTEAYGDSIYVVWTGPDENGDFGDIWRKSRWIWNWPGEWEQSINQSNTPEKLSDFPVMSTDFVTAWHEEADWPNFDIWAKFRPEASSQPIFTTSNPSKHPHICSNWDPNPAVPPTFYCNTIWTEAITPSVYEVKYDRYRYVVEGGHEEKSPLYYAVDIGDTTSSPYCEERDGYLTYGSYSVDYSDQTLKYKLPFLNPQYSYLMRAIVYRTGVGNWIEDVYIDSTLTATILSEPYRPETVWITIPQEFYEYDTEIENEIEKIIGRRALIADLRIYQVESIDSTGGGSGPQSAGGALVQRPLLYQSYPNPFKSRTIIRYSLPVKSKVSLMIYDISGKVVRTLVEENKEVGLYTIAWDGNGDNNRPLAQGVYFCRLITDGFADTKRIILMR